MNSAEFLEKVKNLKYLNKDVNLDFISKAYDFYADFLISENEKYNLTAITNKDEIYLKHFYDSILLLDYFDLENKSVIDVGSGAGFPGIPLAILCPTSKFTLVEPTTKRANFMNQVVQNLGLKNVTILNERAEKLPKKFLDSFDVGTCRAVANLNIICELVLPFVKVGGYFLPYKSLKSDEEILSAKNAIKILKGKIEKTEKISLPELDNAERAFIYIKKIDKSPKKYPRDYSLISNKPLK